MSIESGSSPEAAVAHALGRADGPIAAVQVLLERLAKRKVTSEYTHDIQLASVETARLAHAIAKLQMAQVATALALARLREGGMTLRIVVEHRTPPALPPMAEGGGGASI
jgi:hypothetical protein